ncbi:MULTISPECIES: MobF family relaxase [Thermodesulfovibrio]|jgi:conjugative relaxase-like TrwC/TraI family protein|uniref:MobF family relaxase n=1 Tax=Thermodesulfovibrio TaxID=28261 RepID=UPI00261CB30A|nr:MobF family relaxase [Thermodesulfovibrio sp.]
MVTLTVVNDSKYYTHLKEDSHGLEYYSEKDSVKGFWQGELAKREGLEGKEVTEQDMEKIKGLSNSERLGLDVTYSASKSVSLAYSLIGDERIKEAHEKAVMKANEYLEKNLAWTRQGQGGKEDVQASGVAIANFTHFTSREHDPQLHTHSVVLNSVIRSSDGKITALEPRVIFEHQKALDQIYKNELARNLQELGYKIEMIDRNGNFEIVGFSQEVLDKFSERREQVEQTLKELKENGKFQGLNENELRDIARIDSRQSKEFLSKEELNQIWDEKLSELGITREQIKESVESARQDIKELSEKKQFEATKDYVRQSYSIIHENESAFTKTKLFEIALRQSMNDAVKGQKVMTVSDIEKAFNQLQKEREIIQVKGTEYFTTQDMQKIEKSVIDFVRKTNGTEKEFVSNKEVIDKAIKDYETQKGFQMTEDQKKAVYHIAMSKDKVIGIQGDAGVGKTTSFECIKPLLEKEGFVVRGLAPTGKAAEELSKVGINSQTVDSFLMQFEKTQIVKDIEKYRQEYEKLNQKFENRSWSAPPSLFDKSETWQSQIKNYIVNDIKQTFGLKTEQKGGWGYEYKDKVYVIEKDGWKGQMIVEYGQRFQTYREVNVYLKDVQSGKISHTRFVPVGAGISIKEHQKEYQSPERVIQHGKEVWIVDEASMLGSKKMSELMKTAKEAGARVVVAGDTKQMQSVAQGKIFEEMQKRGMNTIEMTQKVRQTEERYKEVVKEFSEKRFQEAIERLDSSGKVHEVQNKQDRIEAIKQEYFKSDYKKTHIVSATNREKNELNAVIRDELKNQGKVNKEGYVFTVKESKNLSAEEKRYAFSYQIGDSVHIARQDMKEMGISSKVNEFQVKGINSKENTITISNGKNDFRVNLKDWGDKLSVYSQKQIEISKGDKVMTLKNDKKFGVKNGEMWEVKSVDKDGNITIKNNNKEKSFNIKSYNYIDHGYASTVHKSQGMTTKKVIYSVSEKTNYNEMYTAMTRGKEGYSIYTANKQEMYKSMQREQEKTSSLERESKTQTEHSRSAAAAEQSHSLGRGR